MDDGMRVYIAGPQVFTPQGRAFVRKEIVPLLEEAGCEAILPFELGEGEEAAEDKLAWSEQIGKRNIKAIKQADIVLANLDGADVDSGTAAEIAYAAGQDTKVVGYRTDVRASGENEAVAVNLQVESFIKQSGGTIITPRSNGGDADDVNRQLYETEEELHQILQDELEGF